MRSPATASRKSPQSKARARPRTVSRPPEVEAQIRLALAKERDIWLGMAPTLKPETVIHMARHLKEMGDSKLLGDLHPLYTGCITLEFANVGQIPIEIMPGTEICQLFLHKAVGQVPTGTTSSFACRRQPALGKISKSPLMEKLINERRLSDEAQILREQHRNESREERARARADRADK